MHSAARTRRLGPAATLGLAWLLAAYIPALAADAAERAVHGFSSDGRYFAFEQYGVQDGSGFPYADFFVIDLEADEWAVGSPVRVLLKDEQHTVGAARGEALAKARTLLDTLAIGEPGTLLATSTVYQAGTDPRRMTFVPYYRSLGNIEPITADDEDAVVLTLEEIVLPSPRGCPVDDTPKVGFVLKLAHGKASPGEVFRDAAIPASRGCPLAYTLSDVIGFGYGPRSEVRYVALVSVFAHGFEGADRRFLAVPFR